MGTLFVIFLIAVIVVVVAMLYATVLTALYPEHIHTNEIHSVLTPDIWRLRMCRYRKGRRMGEPVLFIHGFLANQNTFTAPEDENLVQHLVDKGYDCWTLDLRGCRSSMPPFEHTWSEATLDDHIQYDIPAAIDYIREKTGFGKVHCVGHSMGGSLLYAYAQISGQDYLGACVTLGAPVGFEGAQVRVPGFLVATGKAIPGLFGGLLRCFVPLALRMKKPFWFFPINFHNLHEDFHTGHFINMLENPAPKALEELAFYVNKKVMRVQQDDVDVVAGFESMPMSLLAFFSPHDPYVPIEKAYAFIDKLPTKDKQLVMLTKDQDYSEDYGHCDLLFGKEGKKEVYQPIADWLKKHPIKEHIAAEEDVKESKKFTDPLVNGDRANLISGESYAHVASDESPAPKKKAAARKKAPAKKKAAPKKKAPAKKKAAPKKKAAAKKKASPKKKAAPKKKAPAKKKAAPKKKTSS